MTFPIEDVVDVIISLGDRPVSQRNFSTPMIMTAHNLYSDRTRIYSSVDDLADDGFSTSSNVYKMVEDILGGPFKPNNVVIGRRVLTDYRVTFDVGNATVYTINVKASSNSATYSKSFSYTSDSDATTVEIATNLAAQIEADVDIASLVTASNSSGTLLIVPVSTYALSVGAVTTNATVKETSSEAATDAWTAIANENFDWFFVLSDSHDGTDIQALANTAQTNKRMFITSSQEAGIFTSATNDIASILKNNQFDNTILVATLDADKYFPEAALIGSWASISPGATTLFGKTLVGTPISGVSSTQANFAKGKNANVYVNRGGVGFFESGVVSSGRYADVTHGALWLEARMEEDVFAEIKRFSDLGKKIPYTDKGIQAIVGVMKKRLDEAVQRDFLASYKVIPPLVDDIATNDKANRLLPDLPFEGVLSGAIHKIVIRGYVAV